MYLFEHLKSLLLIEVPLLFRVQLIKLFFQILVSFSVKLLHLCSDSILVIAVEESHEEVHDEKDANEKEDDEEDCEGAAILVGGEHDVGAVRCRQKHQHVEAGSHIVREVTDTLHRATEDTETQQGKEEHVETNKEYH